MLPSQRIVGKFLLLRLLKRRVNYTISNRSDGFGAQYLAIMAAIAFCVRKNYNYVHTPMKRIEHTSNIKEIIRLNKFIGISPPKHTPPITITKLYPWAVYNSSTPEFYYTDKVLKFLRSCYYSTPKPVLSNTSEIVIHIRRGDVSSTENVNRWTSNNTYKKVIRRLKKIYPRFKIVIHSEGKPKDFSDLIEDRVSLNINDTIERTFHSFVTAKILVVAKSCFSYSAALLNTNTVYVVGNKITWGLAPLPHWKII